MPRHKKGGETMEDRKNNLVIVFTVADVILLIIFLVGITYITQYYKSSNSNKQIYNDIATNITNNITETETITNGTIANEVPENVQKVINLKQENQDTVGWIQIEDTIVDYPLLQSTDKDKDYYLTHNYKNEKTKYGSIYLYKDSNITDINSNVIIYGHNMKDEQMFNTLLKYENKDFYNKHSSIKVATENKENEYTIVSVFKSRIFYQDEKDVFRYYNYTNFEDEKTYNEYIENCKKIQLYDTGVSAEYGEKLITLITCEYSQENGRMVVVAKKESE